MGSTTPGGLPFMQDHDPLSDVADYIEQLAVAVEAALATAGGQEPIYAKANRGTLSLSSGTAYQALDMTADDYTIGGVTRSGGGLVAPVDGLYNLQASLQFAANATGARSGWLFINGAGLTEARMVLGPSPTAHCFTLSMDARLSAGDVVTLQGYQNSGGALNLNTATLAIRRVGPLP